MDCRSLFFRQLPHQPKLFLSYLDEFEKVKTFYEHPPTLEAVKRAVREIAYPSERRTEVTSILRNQNAAFGAGANTEANLERLAKGAVAVVSGQQVGLFGGPAYSVYKALTAIQISEELTASGTEAVPVFWMATEDHDLEEVRRATWFDGGKLLRFEMQQETGQAGKPVGRILLGVEGERLAREAAGLLESAGGDFLAPYLAESYRAEDSYGSSFGKLFARLFAEQGLILLDPLDAALHKVAAPIYQHALAGRGEINEKLLQRGKSLEEAGFEATVKVTAKSTLLFSLKDGTRQVISAGNQKFQAGEGSWPQEELVHLTHREPENFSPNALLRPVVQDYLLPTVASVAGPTEIAYLAQAEVVYRKLLGRMPVVLPRAGFTLVDAKAAKLLQRYELEPEEVWSGSQDLRHKMEKQLLPEGLAEEFERDQKRIAETLVKLGEKVAVLDPTLQGTVEKTKEGITFHLEKLQRKVGTAIDQKNGLLASHEQHLESLLNPHKVLQERELSVLPFLARWGAGGLRELQGLCSSNKLGHHFIVNLP